MKTILLLIAILFSSFNSYAQTWQWTHPEPNGIVSTNDSMEDDIAHDVEVDATGNVYVLGDYKDTLYLNNNFITTGNGSYLAKYDSIGVLLWYKLIKPTGNFVSSYPYYNYHRINASDLTVNSAGVFITGQYDPSSYPFNDFCTTNPTDHKVSYAIGGLNFTSQFNESGLFITKFNAAGNVIWNKLSTEQVCFDNNEYRVPGGIWAGNPLITSDKNNNIISSFIYALNNNKTSFSIGSDVIPLRTSTGYGFLVVAKYNGAGALQWSNYAGGGFPAGKYDGNGYVQNCNSIITDNNGNIFFYGQTKDSTYFGSHLFRTQSNQMNIDGNYGYATFISKISSSGTWQFVKELCGGSTNSLEGANTSSGNPERLAVDDANNVYAIVDGNFGLNIPFVILGDSIYAGNGNITDKYLVKFNNNGVPLWKHGVANASSALNSLIYASKQLYLAGFLAKDNPNADNSRSLIFSALTIPKDNPGNNYFVAKADTAGNFKWEADFSSDRGTFGNAVKYFNGNIYTAGSYIGGITSLGNLNGSFNSQTNISNIFFGKLKDQYIKVGTITPTITCVGGSITVPFISTGLNFSSANIFTAELSDASGSFDSPVSIGSAVSTGTGSITATLPNTLTYGNTYIVRIKSLDTLKTGYNYYAYADTNYKITITCPPPVNLSTTNITATSAKFNWASTACGAKYKIQKRLKGVTTWQNATVSGSANSYIATGLTAGTAYQWRIATICQVSPQIISAYSPIQNFTTASSLVASINSSSDVVATGLNATVIPNPVISSAAVLIKGNKGAVTLTLTDVSGKIIWKSAVSDSRINIPMQNFAVGTYLLSVKDDNQSKVLKLVKAE